MENLDPEEYTAQVKALLARGRKIPAIKLIRAQTGLSLVEAKDAAETIEAELRGISPELYKAAKPKGCASAVLLLLLAAGILLKVTVTR